MTIIRKPYLILLFFALMGIGLVGYTMLNFPTRSNAGSKIEFRNSLTVIDQKADSAVWISKVEVSTPSFVIIRKANVDHTPSEILGVSSLIEQNREPFFIDLNQNTQIGDFLFAAVYSDDGDSVFDIEKDTLLLDTQGKPLLKSFNISF